MAETVKIALVDDHTLFRNGLKGLLSAVEGFEVVAQAGDGVEFLALLAAGQAPEVVLMDIDMPNMDGFALAGKLAADYPGVRCITLSMHGDDEYYFRMVALGVKGFLLKSSDIEEVVTAVRTVARGATYFSQELLTMLVGNLHSQTPTTADESLSERELEILQLICRGLSNQEIGEKLFISKRTVDKHRANILDKTGTRNTANLVMYAIKKSLVEL